MAYTKSVKVLEKAVFVPQQNLKKAKEMAMAIIEYKRPQFMFEDEVDNEYDFFEREDKCVANNYPLDLLREETKKMEDEDEELNRLFAEASAAERRSSL